MKIFALVKHPVKPDKYLLLKERNEKWREAVSLE